MTLPPFHIPFQVWVRLMIGKEETNETSFYLDLGGIFIFQTKQ